jgi:hypothetical protein
LSIYEEPDGKLLAGTDDGQIHELEVGTTGTTTDLGVEIPVTILTPISEGENPLARKDASDFQFHGNTGNSTATVTFYKNGDPIESLVKTLVLPRVDIYRMNLLELGNFIKLQLKLTGSFSAFAMNALNLQIYTKAQQVMALRLGRIIPSQGSDVAWVTQLEMDIESQYDLLLHTYKNDLLYNTQTVHVVPGVRDVYTVPTKRGTKARRLSFVLETTAPDGAGDIGFECYYAKARHANTGNATDLAIGTGDARAA